MIPKINSGVNWVRIRERNENYLRRTQFYKKIRMLFKDLNHVSFPLFHIHQIILREILFNFLVAPDNPSSSTSEIWNLEREREVSTKTFQNYFSDSLLGFWIKKWQKLWLKFIFNYKHEKFVSIDNKIICCELNEY